MVRQIQDVLDSIDARAPFSSAAEWDAVGLQLGDVERPATSLAVAHELTTDVVDTLVSCQADLAITYHPLVFRPLHSVTTRPGPEGRSFALIEAGVAVIAVHTNWDVAEGGTADSLANALGLRALEPFGAMGEAHVEEDSPGSIGRIGDFDGTAPQLISVVSTTLGGAPRTVGMSAVAPSRVAVLPGSGGSFVGAAAAAGADVLVSGDFSHHDTRRALDLGLAIVDAGHAPTERPGVRALYAAVVEIVGSAIDLTGIDDSPWEGG